jgi:hypothetical protein
MLRTALGGQANGDDDTQSLLRTMLLLDSPMAWLYWSDYLGLEPADAAAIVGWALKATHDAHNGRKTTLAPAVLYRSTDLHVANYRG